MPFVQDMNKHADGAVNRTVVLTNTPTPNNLLVCFFTAFNGFGTIGSGWTSGGVTVNDANGGQNRLQYHYVQPGDGRSLDMGGVANNNFWAIQVTEISSVTGVWTHDLASFITGTQASPGNPTITSRKFTVASGSLAFTWLECPQGASPTGAFEAAWTEQMADTGGGYGYGNATRNTAGVGEILQNTITYSHGFTQAYIVAEFRQSSGYTNLYANSYDAGATLAAAAPPMFVSDLMPRQHWFNPTMCGTVSHVLMSVVKTGSPAAKRVELEIWRTKNGGNGFNAITSADYDLLSAGHIDPASIPAATAVTSNFWLTVPVTPFYVDDTNNAGQSRAQGFGFGYALKLLRTTANSDNTANDQYGMIISNSLDPQMGSYINSGLARFGNVAESFDHVEPLFVAQGNWRSSSHFLDFPSSKTSFVHSIIAFQTMGDFGAANAKRAIKITAIGSYITRTAWAVRWDGTGYKGVYAGLYTHNVNSDLPDTCLGTSDLITAAAGGANFYTGDIDDLQLPAMFQFNTGSGLAVTSGDSYWLTFEQASGSVDGANIALSQYLQQGQRRASFNNSWVAADSQGWQVQWWYRTSFTDSVAGGVPQPTSVPGAVYRSFPVGQYRSFPVGTFRSFPKG